MADMDYRGATVEDLDPLPVVSVTPATLLGAALDLSFEQSFSHLPVLDENRSLLGYLTAEQLETTTPRQRAEPVSNHFIKFKKNRKFVPITPETPLEELSEFFKSSEFAVITDGDRRFVLGVATPDDLQKYVQSRPFLSAQVNP